MNGALHFSQWVRSAIRKEDGQLDWPLLVALFVAFVAVMRFLVLFFGTLTDPIFDDHPFRQSQTAITVQAMLSGGNLIAYETPVFGSPWTIPFEFPVYQLSVYILCLVTGLDIDPAGRIVSALYLMGTIALGIGVLKELVPKIYGVTGAVFTALLLFSPQYLFWGRSVLVETCALFFCTLFLLYAIKFYRHQKWVYLFLALLGSVLGVLAKATTWPAFVVLFAIFWICEIYSRRTVNLRASGLLVGVGIVSFAIIHAWNGYADDLKSLSLFGQYLTSDDLASWNFGSFEDRFSTTLWATLMPSRMLPASAGYLWPLALLSFAGLYFIKDNKKLIVMSVAAVFGFFLAILLFTNLHIVHSYYQTANGIFLIFGIAVVIAVSMRSGLRLGVVASVVFILVCGGQIAYFQNERLKRIENNNRNAMAIQVGDIVQREVPIGKSMFVFGYDWSSEVHYYSNRRGVAFPPWFRNDDFAAALDNPQTVLGDYPLGAIIDCRRRMNRYDAAKTEYINAFLANNPGQVFTTKLCDVVVLPDRGL